MIPYSRFPDKDVPLNAMLSHRKKVLRQVSGQPLGALEAVLKRFKKAVLSSDTALQWRREDADSLSKADGALIGALTRKGFLSFPHAVKQVEQREAVIGPHALPNHGGPGTVVMASNRLGDFEAHPTAFARPEDEAHHWAHQDGVEKVYERWFILLHELAHCEYPSLSHPFRPTPGRYTEDFVQAMNRWQFGPLSLSTYSTRSLLNEGHSDALAALMLFHVSHGDPRAEKVVQATMRARVKCERRVAAKIAKNLHEGAHPRGDFVDEHCTGAALYKLLKEGEGWESASPQEVKERALQYASDGLMVRLSTHHPLERFQGDLAPEIRSVPVGRVLSETLIAPQMDGSRLVNTLFWLWYVESSGGDAHAWLSSQDQGHPLLPILTEAFRASQASPRIQQVRELYDSSGKGDAFVQALVRGSPWLNAQMAPEIERILGKICVPENPEWRHAEEVHHSDMEVIRLTLGLPERERMPVVVPEDVREFQDFSPPRQRVFSP